MYYSKCVPGKHLMYQVGVIKPKDTKGKRHRFILGTKKLSL